jgi:hypothetical protein
VSDLPILLARDFVKTPGQPRLLVERRFRPGGVFAEEQLKNAGTDQALVKAAQDDLDRVHPGYPFSISSS